MDAIRMETGMSGGRGPRPLKRGMLGELWGNRILYLMLVPALVSLLLFSYGPMFGLSIVLFDYNPVKGILKSPFVGLKHFQAALQNRYFIQALVNTLVIKIGQTILTFPLSILLALFMNEVGKRMKQWVQTASILPYFVSWIVIAAMFRNLLTPSHGVVNEVLVNWFGLVDPIGFLSDPEWFRPIIIFQDTWKMSGFFALIYLAAMTAIDHSLYEGAVIDGAGRWRQMWSITLPGIRPTLLTMMILLTGYLVLGPFEQVFSQYGPTVYSTGDIVETFSFRLGISQYKYSFATAVGLMQSVVASTLVILTNRLAKRKNDEGMF